MPKISFASLDDYYSSNPLDSSANFGFNLTSPESDATPEDAFIRFQNAAYAFANADRDPELKGLANQHFGSNMLNPTAQDTPYWLGSAVLNQLGHDNIFNAYQQFNVPIPEDAADEAELISTLGHNLMQKYRASYDKRKSLRAASVKKCQDLFTQLRDGTITPEQLTPENYQEVLSVTGYSPHDIALAGKAVRLKEQNTLGNKIASTAAVIGTGVMEGLAQGVEAVGSAIKGNISQAGYILRKGSSRKQKTGYEEASQYAADAWATVEREAELMRLAKNPLHVRQIATDYYRAREEAYQKELMAAGRVARDVNKAVNAIITGGQYAVKGAAMPITGPAPDRQSLMQGAALESNLRDASLEARANIAQQGHGSMLEEAATTTAAIAPYMNPYTATLSSIDLFTENAGRGFSNIAGVDGSIDASYFTEASAKAAAQAGISWGTRAVGYGAFTKVASKVAPRLLNNTLGFYATNAAFTGANFATVVPAMDAALNATWDAVFVSHPQLKTGGKQVQELLDNIQSPRYWGIQMAVGGLLSTSSTYTHYNAKTSRDALITWGKLQGLSDREANAIVATTPLTQAPEAIIDKVKDKITNHPEKALKDKVKNINDFLSEEDANAARVVARSVLADSARRASLQLRGIGIEADPADSNRVLVSEGGYFDEATKSFKPGNRVVSMDMADAELYIGSIFTQQDAFTARAVRDALANNTMLDAAKKIFGDRLAIEAIADPVSLDKIVELGKKAEKLLAERTRNIMQDTAGEDGKPSLSESEAAKRAAAENHPSLHKTHSLAELIKFGKNAEMRIAQAKEQLGKDAEGVNFTSNAFVVTPQNYSKDAVKRILKIAQGASPREIAEEFAHMYLEDYLANTGSDYADAWRILHALQNSVEGDNSIKLTTLEKEFPALFAKLTGDNPASFDSLTTLEKDIVRQEAQEGFASLTLSDLRYRAQQGEISLPDWSRPVFDADLVMRSVMQNELATAAALNASRDIGFFDENAQRLLRASADTIASVLSEVKNPTPNQFYNAYHRASEFFAKATLDHTPEQTIADLDRWEAAANTTSSEPSPLERKEQANTPTAELEAKQKAIDELIAAEMEADPNISEDEATNKVSQQIIDAKEADTAEQPGAVYDPSLNTHATETTDARHMPCRFAVLPVANLKLLPNFKIGSDKKTGVKNQLVGPYKADHPPICVFHDPADGSLTVISGRHRLDHAKRNGITKISAYIYDKSPERDIVWVQKNDVEWNIMDGQATATEVALYIRGEFIPGVPALNEAEIAQNNIYLRNESSGQKGYVIATRAMDDVIYALRDGSIDDNQAYAIANTSSNPIVQRKGLRDALDNTSAKGIAINMAIEASRLAYLQERGEYIQADFFGEIQDPVDSVLNQFVQDYARKRINQYENMSRARNAAKIVAATGDTSLLANTGLRFDNAAHKRSSNLKNKPTDPKLLKSMWESVWQHMDTFGDEIDAAFKEAHPKEWQELHDRKAQQQVVEIIEETPDLGNEVQGDVSNIPTLFSVIGEHALTWNDYTDRIFKGRDDGKMRAELDASQAKLKDSFLDATTLGDALDFPELFAAYPQLKDIIFSIKDLGFLTKGESDGKSFVRLNSSLSENEILSTLLHEVQHVIQGIEGFISGSNIIHAGGFDSYARVSGEIEARNVQYRLNWTPEQRLATPFNETLEYKGEALVFKKGVSKKLLQDTLSQIFAPITTLDKSMVDRIINYAISAYRNGETISIQQAKDAVEFALKCNNQHLTKPSYARFELNTYPSFLRPLIKFFTNKTRRYQVEIKKELAEDSKQLRRVLRNINSLESYFKQAREALAPYVGKDGYYPASVDFSTSISHLERWQVDPTAGLGELGHFGNNLSAKLATLPGEENKISIGSRNIQPINAYNQRVVRMLDALKRRRREITHILDQSNVSEKDSIALFAEMSAINTQINNILPQGYRFSLEPYHIFDNVYSDLWGKGDSEHAVQNIPMGEKWQRKMYYAFEKQLERILSGELSTEHESAFFDLFNEFTFNVDIQHIRNEYVRMREEAIDEVNARFDDHTTREYKRARTEALTNVYDTLKAENPVIFEALYKAIGQIRAHRLMDKFLARVIMKLDEYRKDLTLGAITSAINRVTPRHEKNGKPLKGTVTPEMYNKVLDNYRLMLLTPGQKDAMDEKYAKALDENAEPDTIIDIDTYDKDGAPTTIKVTVEQYQTYACFEEMTPEQADSAAQALGTLLKYGKEAWSLAREQARQRVKDFCQQAMADNPETPAEEQTRKEDEALYYVASGHKISNFGASLLNDMQLFDFIANNKGLQQFHSITQSIARAHTYIEEAEHFTISKAFDAACKAAGSTKRKEVKKWLDHINTNKKCKIVLTEQLPDFEAKNKATLRQSLDRRLWRYTDRTKNFSANKFAKALEYLLKSKTLPEDIAKEVKAKYGTIGDSSKYKGSAEAAFNDLFTEGQFKHLRNFKQSLKTRTEESIANYHAKRKKQLGLKDDDKTPPMRSVTIEELSPNVAAYRILMSEQADLAENMRIQGYTPEVIQQLREIAGEDMMQYAYALRDMLNLRTPELKAIYEATFGTPFPQVENYFRAFFDVNNQETLDAVLSGMSHGQGKADGAITIFRTRVKHNAKISPTMSTTGAFLIGMKQQDNIIAYSNPDTHQHLATFLRQAFNYKDANGRTFKEALTKALGTDIADAAESQIDNMMKLFGEGDKGDKGLAKLVSDFSKSSAYAILNGRFSSLAKNILALFNTIGASDIVSMSDWFMSLGRVALNRGMMKKEDVAKLPFIERRYKGFHFDTDKEALFSLTRMKNAHGATDATYRAGLTLLGQCDRYASTRSAAIIYDAHYRALQRENPDMPHEALHAEALMVTERSLYKKGQPMDWRSRSLDFAKGGWKSTCLYFLGGESINTFANCIQMFGKACTLTKQHGLNATARKAWGNLIGAWIANGALMSLINWGYYALTDDEEHWKKRTFVSHMFWGTLLGPITGIPIVSELANLAIESGFAWAGYSRYAPYLSNSGLLPLGDLRRVFKETAHLWNSKKSAMDKIIATNNLVRGLCSIVLFSNVRPTTKTGAAAKGAALAGTFISNVLDFLLRTARAADERFLE